MKRIEGSTTFDVMDARVRGVVDRIIAEAADNPGLSHRQILSTGRDLYIARDYNQMRDGG